MKRLTSDLTALRMTAIRTVQDMAKETFLFGWDDEWAE